MINRAVLVGRLTKDIDLRKTQNGVSCAMFTVACDRRRSQDQEQQADFITCVAWRQPAEFLDQYAVKGSLVGIDGRIQTRSYDNREGQRVYLTEVVADNVRLLDNRKHSSTGSDKPPVTSGSYTRSSYDPAEAKQEALNWNDEENGLDISNDDLPF